MENSIDEQELAITYLREMLPTYVEGHGYEEHPLPEYYAIETAIETMHKYRQVKEAYKQYLKNIVTNIYADKKLVQVLSEIFKTNEAEFLSR